VGFGQLLGPINAAVNAVLNQLIDAGTLQNVGGGFIGRGLSMRSGNIRFKMGEYVAVNAPGAKIRDAIVPMEFPGPSPVLFQLLGFLTEAGREIASVKDILTGQAQSADMSPTTLLALIEQGLKVFTAIYKRVHRAAKKEYAKLYRLNRIYLEDRAQYQVGEEWKEITREDYARGSGVVPVSDPSMITDMQKLARGQFLMGFRADPLMDGAEILRRALDAAQIPDVEDLFAKQQQPDPAVVASTKEIELKGLKLMAEIEEIGQKMETDASTARAQQTKTYADAILALAKADTENGELDLAWTQQQLEALKVRMEAVNRASEPVAAVEPSAVEPVQ
jgi:chaperonin GroES